jgi:hypothetical protein
MPPRVFTHHTTEPGFYYQYDLNTLTSLRGSLTLAEKLLAKKIIRDFKDLLYADKIPQTMNPLLLQPGDEKFTELFGPAFQRCTAWIDILEACIAQKCPSQFYTELLRCVEDQLEIFCQRVKYLKQFFEEGGIARCRG